MGMIKVDEPFAKPPKLSAVRQLPPWGGDLDPNRGFAEISDASLDGIEVDLYDLERLEIENGHLSATTMAHAHDELEISLAGSLVERCDLSRLRLTVVRQSQLVGLKLTGTDFSGGALRDVEFVDCMLHLTSFRMAELVRVTFTNCTFEDVDAYSAGLTDVTFPGSRLSALNLDQTSAQRVDLREAELDGLKGLSSLEGFLIAEHQLPALAFQLADAVGLSIEDTLT